MKTIGVISLKGGVGKTSVVSALGAAIASFGKKVLLVDANFSAPNLGLHFGYEPEITIHDVLNGRANINHAIYNVGDFDIIPASLHYRGEINFLKLKDKLKILKNRYDVILIDSSPALNEETLSVILATDSLIVVTTPDFPTLNTTLKSVKIARQRGTPINGLVINKVYNKDFELSLEEIERKAEVPVMAVIPHDVNILKALSEFTPSTIFKPKSGASQEYYKLAAVLIGEKFKPVKLKRFFRWVNPQKQDINRMIFYKSLFGNQ